MSISDGSWNWCVVLIGNECGCVWQVAVGHGGGYFGDPFGKGICPGVALKFCMSFQPGEMDFCVEVLQFLPNVEVPDTV